MPEERNPNFKTLQSKTTSINTALKKEKIVHTIKELSADNPNKGITWLRKKASQLLTEEGLKGYSYRQIMRDTKGLKIN